MTGRVPGPVAALAGGVLVALSLPPFGWWWLAWIGFGMLANAIADQPWPHRIAAGFALGVGQFGVGLFWMREFTLPGTFLCVLLESLFIAAAAGATPRRLSVALPAALVVVEAGRGAWPFGGLPLAGAALGQISGPLGGTARVGGGLLLVGLASAVGALGAQVIGPRRGDTTLDSRLLGAVGLLGVVTIAVFGAVAPDGSSSGETIDAVAVQGGGPRGLRAIDTDPGLTYDRHVAALEDVEPGPDLVLLPEDVVDVPARIDLTIEGDALGGIADELDTTLIVGVVEDVGETRFDNAAAVWNGDGELIDRYDKVHRVPFGEYIPFRSLVGRLADISAVPRDARPGKGPGLVRTPAGDLGVLISYEVFFADRGRAAVNAGAEVLLVPTNASSFTDSQVPTQQVAAARLRAVETGRHLLQAGPTGYSAHVDHRGNVITRSVLGVPAIVEATLPRRTGTTIYARWGDWWLVLLATAVIAAMLIASRRPEQEGVT